MMHEIGSSQAEAVLRQIEERRGEAGANALRVADEAIAGVRERGDAYVAEQVARFDGVEIAPGELLRAFSPRQRGEGARRADEGPSPGASRHPLPLTRERAL
ncbi:MAG TPA: hypothetical protein VNA04_14985, partial [Thermoanaerobaculia bacterium]|nr:hypothetical protein [Thermoanaerobaculia bacterium]